MRHMILVLRIMRIRYDLLQNVCYALVGEKQPCAHTCVFTGYSETNV